MGKTLCAVLALGLLACMDAQGGDGRDIEEPDCLKFADAYCTCWEPNDQCYTEVIDLCESGADKWDTCAVECLIFDCEEQAECIADFDYCDYL